MSRGGKSVLGSEASAVVASKYAQETDVAEEEESQGKPGMENVEHLHLREPDHTFGVRVAKKTRSSRPMDPIATFWSAGPTVFGPSNTRSRTSRTHTLR
jgi:hypothetical protein